MKYLLILTLLLIRLGVYGQDSEIFTWLKWDATTGYKVETRLESIGVELRDPVADKVLKNRADIESCGWRFISNKFIETPPRDGGKRMVFHVTNLPLGRHAIYIRFHGRPRNTGETWWYLTFMGTGNGIGGGNRDEIPKEWRLIPGTPSKACRIIDGTGGYDENNIWEYHLATIGSDKSPTDSVSFGFARYVWSQLARIGEIRIESYPDLKAPETLRENSLNVKMQNLFIPDDIEKSYGVKITSGAVKIRPIRFDELKSEQLENEINLQLAKNEYENAQAIIFSKTKDLKNIQYKLSQPLKNANGLEFAGKITVNPVGFVVVNNADIKNNGYWPDPILDYADKLELIPRGILQPIWVNVYADKDAAPGVYKGTLRIKPAIEPGTDIPITVTVRNFTLPDISYFKTAFSSPHLDYMAKYKFCPGSIYGWDANFDNYWPNLAALKTPALNLEYLNPKEMDQKTKMPDQKYIEKLIKNINERLKAAEHYGLRQSCYIYGFDECYDEWIPAMKEISTILKKSYPEIKILSTAHREWYGDNSIKDIEWWCPRLDTYAPRHQQAVEARKRGRQVWTYVCNSPVKPYPNVFVASNSAISQRLMLGFMAQAYQWDGFLYYCTIRGWNASPGITGGQFTNWVDTFKDDFDGQLYAPTPDNNQPAWMKNIAKLVAGKRPLPGIRMENFRDGLEDYDYMQIAKRIANSKKLSPSLQNKWEELKPYYDLNNEVIRSATQYTQSYVKVQELRNKFADFIEAASNDKE